MKKIYSLYISNLNNKQHYTFMQLAVAACALYPIIGVDFRKLAEALGTAFEHEDDVFIHHDRTEITNRVVKADDERIRLFRHLRDFIKTYETCSDEAKLATAAILLKIIATYGGGSITGMKADERSAALSNLVEDFERIYPAQVAQLGCTVMVAALKEANQTYLEAVTERAQFDAENGMAIVATARKQTDTAYQALVAAVNAAATVDAEGLLTPFIDYMNVNVRHYRMNIGQSLADMDGTTSSGAASGDANGGVVMKTATFEFVGGRKESFPVEVGTVIPVPSNTEGYKWKPEIPELMPKTNKTFREVPLEDREVRLTFHFLSHEDEEIRGIVGTAFETPANTVGCHWEPSVPSVFPEEDMTFNEVLDEPSSSEEEDGEQNGGTNNDELTAATGITVKWTYNRAAVPEGSLLAKEMIVAPGTIIPASEWPEAHPGYHWNSTPEQMNDSVPYKRPGEWYYVREQPDEEE